MRQWRLRLGTVTCAAMLSAVSMPLAAESKTVNMTLTIVVNAAPPCTVTGGEVEFGNVLTTKVDGVNYRQAVGYRLSCNGRVSDYLKLQIQGNAVTIQWRVGIANRCRWIGYPSANRHGWRADFTRQYAMVVISIQRWQRSGH
ncbi:minor fimbrial subunit [Salmonella enterica subsp. enterica]|uniref:Minor fimbrial subunit n=1 Tax=Salmonella enterica I TaxID=59201 RepID=A0A379WZH9_SALET|nr:minor fimbrial subunit [Salmonella enterica subsp. enterica]